MKAVAIPGFVLLLLVFGCGAEHTASEEDGPGGHAGSSDDASAHTGGQGGSGANEGNSGFMSDPPVGGIGAVDDPYMSTGGAGEPFEIACRFNGIEYARGEAMPTVDGCNVCTCGTQGIECSDRPCRGRLSADGDSQDGDPYIECDERGECPTVDCECIDEDGDRECDQHCPNFFCVSGICVDMGSRPCSPADPNACLENELCQYSVDAACGTVGRGSCMLIVNEERCTQEASPACGCDGVEYHNACLALAAGHAISPTDICE